MAAPINPQTGMDSRFDNLPDDPGLDPGTRPTRPTRPHIPSGPIVNAPIFTATPVNVATSALNTNEVIFGLSAERALFAAVEAMDKESVESMRQLVTEINAMNATKKMARKLVQCIDAASTAAEKGDKAEYDKQIAAAKDVLTQLGRPADSAEMQQINNLPAFPTDPDKRSEFVTGPLSRLKGTADAILADAGDLSQVLTLKVQEAQQNHSKLSTLLTTLLKAPEEYIKTTIRNIGGG